MTNQFTAENPNEIRFTAQLTYSLSDWHRIAMSLDHYSGNFATDQLRRDIKDMIRQAVKVYYPESEK